MSDQQGKAGAPQPPTIRPPFDPEEFARETDTRMRHESEPASGRPTAPPPAPGSRASASNASVPTLAVSRDDLEWFSLSGPAREVLGQVNGRDTVEKLAGALGMPTERALTELEGLAREGVITWIEPDGSRG